MNYPRLATLASLLVVAGCDSTPTAPSAVLTVSQSTVSLGRTMTAQITATSTAAGVSTDVTSTGSWQSSNAQVATVAGGWSPPSGRVRRISPSTMQARARPSP